MTEVQRNILRLLYDPETEQAGTSHLHNGLDASATTLVTRGWIWKKEGHRGRHPRPTYGLSPEGIAAAQAAWQDAT